MKFLLFVMFKLRHLFLSICTICTILMVNSTNGQQQQQQQQQCKYNLLKHYEELGCVAHYEAGNPCPIYYECRNENNFTALNPFKCYFNNVEYAIDEHLNKDSLPECSKSCKCTYDMFFKIAKFVCDQVACPDLMAATDLDRTKCESFKKWNQCCDEQVTCDSRELKTMATCQLENHTYYEGQVMYPFEDQCYICECTDGFRANIPYADNANCYHIKYCDTELLYLYRFQQGCVPVYFGINPCCPSNWRCPNEVKDKILPSRSPRKDLPQCHFGQLSFWIGDKLNHDCMKCSCETPPLLTCTQSADCMDYDY